VKETIAWIAALIAAVLLYIGIAIAVVIFAAFMGVLILIIAVVGLAEEIREGWKK
jgi:hypothetical protein